MFEFLNVFACRKAVVGFLLLGSAAVLGGCGAQDAINATKSMPGYMQNMTDQMKITNEAVRLQKLVLAKNDLFDDKNTRDPFVPSSMIGPAEKLVEAATAEEIIGMIKMWSVDINDVTPSEYDKATPERSFAFDHGKLVRAQAIQVVAAVTPPEKVMQIVHEQIEEGGEFYDTAFIFLTARQMFLRDYEIDNRLKPLSSLKKLRKALAAIEQLDYIEKLPYTDELQWELKNFIDTGYNGVNKVSIGSASAKAHEVLRKIDTELKPRFRARAEAEGLVAQTRAFAL